MNGSRVESPAALRAALEAASRRPVVVDVRRAGRKRSVRVKPTLDEAGQARIGIVLSCCQVLVPAGAECGWPP